MVRKAQDVRYESEHVEGENLVVSFDYTYLVGAEGGTNLVSAGHCNQTRCIGAWMTTAKRNAFGVPQGLAQLMDGMGEVTFKCGRGFASVDPQDEATVERVQMLEQVLQHAKSTRSSEDEFEGLELVMEILQSEDVNPMGQ